MSELSNSLWFMNGVIRHNRFSVQLYLNGLHIIIIIVLFFVSLFYLCHKLKLWK